MRLKDLTFEELIRRGYEKDPVVQEQSKTLGDGFSRNRNGLLLFQERIYIPTGIRTAFVQQQHELPAHGHQGIAKTLARLSRQYYFPGIRGVVKEVVTTCDTCIRNKSSRHAPYGLMKSPSTPNQPWKSVALDFVVKLPPSKDPMTQVVYDSILVITDRLTKYAYMIPYWESSTAEQMADTFLRWIIAQHGTPDEIISDRDKLFKSRFWATLMARLGINRKLSTAFHPQSDGQTERINQTMEAYLRCYVNYKQDNWVALLPMAQFAFNSADAETTGISPFFANFGFNPTAYQHPSVDTTNAEAAIIKVDELKDLHKELAADILFLSQRSAIYYNSKRGMGPTLKEGDKVYLLRKNINTQRPSDKLDHKKLGPFKITKVIGKVNYELQLPKTWKIHNRFHISLLEKAPPGAPAAPVTDIQPVNPDAEYEVETILDHKQVRNKTHYLIKWLNYPLTENTWEPERNLNCPEKLQEYHRQEPRNQDSTKRSTMRRTRTVLRQALGPLQDSRTRKDRLRERK